MAATKPKTELAKTTPVGLGSLVQDGNWDFATIFNAPIARLSTQQLAGAWLLVDLMADVTKDRKEALRVALLDEAEKRGTLTEKGHFTMDVEGTEVIREKRQGKTPDEEGLKALLEKYHIKRDDCFDVVEHVSLNHSKLESLVETGKLPAAEVEALKKTAWALKIKPDAQVEKDLETVKSRLGKAKPAKALKG